MLNETKVALPSLCVRSLGTYTHVLSVLLSEWSRTYSHNSQRKSTTRPLTGAAARRPGFQVVAARAAHASAIVAVDFKYATNDRLHLLCFSHRGSLIVSEQLAASADSTHQDWSAAPAGGPSDCAPHNVIVLMRAVTEPLS